MDEKEVLMTWLGGSPVEIQGVVYIYPHGQTAVRKILKANTNFASSPAPS